MNRQTSDQTDTAWIGLHVIRVEINSLYIGFVDYKDICKHIKAKCWDLHEKKNKYANMFEITIVQRGCLLSPVLFLLSIDEWDNEGNYHQGAVTSLWQECLTAGSAVMGVARGLWHRCGKNASLLARRSWVFPHWYDLGKLTWAFCSTQSKLVIRKRYWNQRVAATLSQICVWKYAPEQKRVLLKNN